MQLNKEIKTAKASWICYLVGLVLIALPCVSSAAEVLVAKTHAEKSLAALSNGEGVLALTNVLELPQDVSQFTLQYTPTEITAINNSTNALKVMSPLEFVATRLDSDFGRFIQRHMTKDEEFRFVSCDPDSSRVRKLLASVSSGYGEFFCDDTDSVTFRGSNGTRWESPGYLYVRSGFEF